ncbi:6-phosphogluconolactonase [Microbacterium sp.]|uniref:6-phosphogluconolactonase n=1 Tax=Microbacterium sp. TaxID=51671 RepID=UPI0039E448EE
MSETQKRVVIGPDPVVLAASVAARFLRLVAARLADADLVHVALAGGTAATSVLRAVGVQPGRADVDWSRVHVWWTDESLASRDSGVRDEKRGRAALMDQLALPDGNVHAMAASGDLDRAAVDYAAELSRFGDGDQPWPSFDVCLLGVGADGHIASLFPDRGEIQVVDRSVVAVRDAPMPPPERLSLTRPVINSSREVWMVLTGSDKAPALGLALAGASYQSVPAAGAKGRERTLLFVDRAAAADVPAELIEQDD